MNTIEVQDLEVSFGARRVLNGITLSVPSGTVCALLGPNGAGKTTLIKTLVNIFPSQRGTSRVLEVSSKDLTPCEFERIGYVSESQELPLWMTVKQFISFCRSLYPKWDHNWCERMITEMNLSQYMQSTLQTLSRGMRVKASLISSLAYHPELLILDEPFSGLDPIVRDEFIDAVIQLATEVNATTLISSHDLAEVERISDSIAFLHEGKIAIHSPLDQLVNSYKRVTAEIGDSPITNAPSNWLGLTQQGSIIQFVDTAYDQQRLLADLSRCSPKASIKEAEHMSLKEIYRVLIGKKF